MSLSAEQQRRLLELALHGTRAERETAYRALIHDFRRPAMSVICRTLRAGGVSMEHAEEALQQAIYNFFAGGALAFRGESSVRTYFVRSALYAAVDTVRLAARTRPLADDALEAPSVDAGGAPPESQAVMIEALRSCIGELSAENAAAIRLYYLQQAGSCAACAAALGISTEAFMKRLERARRRLAACVRRRALCANEAPGAGR